MDAFLNLTLFVAVFYVITLYAGWRERRKTKDTQKGERLGSSRAHSSVAAILEKQGAG